MKHLFVLFALLLVFPPTAHSEGLDGYPCKKVWSRVGEFEFLESCSYDGVDYEICIEAPLKGMTRGTWYFYNNWGNDADVPLPGVAATGPQDAIVVGGLSVFSTHSGDIIAREISILNWDLYVEYFALSTLEEVIGGTGRYEGAIGWLGVVASEVEGGILTGEVCGPNVRFHPRFK